VPNIWACPYGEPSYRILQVYQSTLPCLSYCTTAHHSLLEMARTKNATLKRLEKAGRAICKLPGKLVSITRCLGAGGGVFLATAAYRGFYMTLKQLSKPFGGISGCAGEAGNQLHQAQCQGKVISFSNAFNMPLMLEGLLSS
jgi:hypothetical protein